MQRHELIVVERGLQYLPLFLGSTLMQQLGVTKISMPRNRIRELHCFELAPAVGCRSLIMLKELRMPGNGLRYLPDDIGLLRQLTTRRPRKKLPDAPTPVVHGARRHVDVFRCDQEQF